MPEFENTSDLVVHLEADPKYRKKITKELSV
jgi:hypothetical protein